MTQRFPEVIDTILNGPLKNMEIVLDGEIVPVDKQGNILPF